MSALGDLLDLQAGGDDVWTATGHGPSGKRAYGGQFLAQTMAAAARTVPEAALPTSLHVQFLRGGDPQLPTAYAVERSYDGRTAMTRRVLAHQDARLLSTATASFAVPLPGPAHGRRELPCDPERLARTGPSGPAPGLPLDELDIRIADDGEGTGFVRRLWWRATVQLPAHPLAHLCVALFVSDIYLLDPALRVHGHAMVDRTHRSGTTDAAAWFHRDIRADRWNLLESRSPAAARGRGLVTATLVDDGGEVCATIVQEGLIANRDS